MRCVDAPTTAITMVGANKVNVIAFSALQGRPAINGCVRTSAPVMALARGTTRVIVILASLVQIVPWPVVLEGAAAMGCAMTASATVSPSGMGTNVTSVCVPKTAPTMDDACIGRVSTVVSAMRAGPIGIALGTHSAGR